MKIYMIILDGVADRKIKMLNNKTPLEYATTPGLSKLASNGSECMIDVIGDNIIPESDSGAMLCYHMIHKFIILDEEL